MNPMTKIEGFELEIQIEELEAKIAPLMDGGETVLPTVGWHQALRRTSFSLWRRSGKRKRDNAAAFRMDRHHTPPRSQDTTPFRRPFFPVLFSHHEAWCDRIRRLRAFSARPLEV